MYRDGAGGDLPPQHDRLHRVGPPIRRSVPSGPSIRWNLRRCVLLLEFLCTTVYCLTTRITAAAGAHYYLLENQEGRKIRDGNYYGETKRLGKSMTLENIALVLPSRAPFRGGSCGSSSSRRIAHQRPMDCFRPLDTSAWAGSPGVKLHPCWKLQISYLFSTGNCSFFFRVDQQAAVILLYKTDCLLKHRIQDRIRDSDRVLLTY